MLWEREVTLRNGDQLFLGDMGMIVKRKPGKYFCFYMIIYFLNKNLLVVWVKDDWVATIK